MASPTFHWRPWLPYILCLLVALLLGLWQSLSGSDWVGFRVTDERSRTEAVEVPYLTVGRGPELYTFEGTLLLEPLAPRKVRIVPDDELVAVRINDRDIDLSELEPEQLRDVQRGVVVDLGEAARTGENQVWVQVRDFGGEYGLAFRTAYTDAGTLLRWTAWAVLLATVFLLATRGSPIPLRQRLLYLLIFAGCAVQVWYVFTYNPLHHIFSDPQRHWEQGIDVVRRDLMALTDPIGYQLYVAVLAKLSLREPVLVAYFTSILALVGPWFWYRFLRELQSSKTLALAGWAALIWMPSWTAIYAYFMQETLMLPLLGLALWATFRCRRKATAASFGWMIAFWTLVGLTRGVAIPMAALASTWLWLAQDQKVRKALVGGAILIFMMGPLTYRAYAVVGHFAPHGMGHLNVIYAQSGKKSIQIKSEMDGARWTHFFGSPSTGAEPFDPFSDWKTRREGTVVVDIDLDEGMRDWSAEGDKIDLSVRDYLWITKENLIFLFFAKSWPDDRDRLIDNASKVMRYLWAPLFLALWLATFWYWRRLRGHWLLPGLIAVWFLVQGLVPIAINEGRYRKPYEGLACAHLILLIAARRSRLREAAPAVMPWANLSWRSRREVPVQEQLL